MTDWREAEARNEVRSRGTNEWIEAAHDSFGEGNVRDRYLCECSDLSCTSTVALTRVEYEAVRADGHFFAIEPHHENPELDALVVEYARYSIVAKLPGVPAQIAYASDPRRPSGGDVGLHDEDQPSGSGIPTERG
jgi:hypothetical protein